MDKASLKNYPKFKLGSAFTKEQLDFFNKHGFVHFTGVFSPEEVKELIEGYELASKKLIASKDKMVNGIPVIFGLDENGQRIVQRFPYTSEWSERIHEMAIDQRIQMFKNLLAKKTARVAEDERDGVVFNHYVNSKYSKFKQMGWHTDSLREIFFGKKVYETLNIGIYMDSSSAINGGLRVLPGTHKQTLFGILFKKMYYRNTKEDKDEVLVVASPGDVVVHHGHMWHRVGHSEHKDGTSRRRIMYIPVLCGPKQKPKMNGNSKKTPVYHRFQSLAKFDKVG
jgi:phytanoyl-CoA hydroxylase